MSQDNLEVFSRDTFLTSLRNAGGGSAIEHGPSPSKSTVEEPDAMAIVRDRHAQLHEVVGSLSEKISAVLGRQEKDFLAAYRAHMYNVQKELHDMREKIHRNETVENKTEKIKKIEEERDWYRKEALRLDAFTTSMTKDLKYMKEKLEAIEEDRNWLEKQLKACKKQNKLLRAELDVRIASPVNISGADGGMLPIFDAPSKGGGGGGTTGLRRPAKRSSETSVTGGASGLGAALPYLNIDAPAQSPTSMSDEREEKLRRQVKTLKRELQQKNQELNGLKQQRLLGKDDEQRSHLENFFIQCVESVKEEVIKRRHGGGSGNFAALDRKHDKTAQRASNADRTRNQRYDVGPEFEDFTSSDRVRLIERLLAHDEVLTFLYEHLFPSPTAQTNATSTTTPSSSASSMEREALAMRSVHPLQLFQASESTVSLPDTTMRSSELVIDASSGLIDAGRLAGSSIGKSVSGSGAAAARGGGLPLDASTKEYLRAMRQSASASMS